MIFKNSATAYVKRMTSKKNGTPYLRVLLNKDEILKLMGDNTVLEVRVMDQNEKEDKNGNGYVSGYISSWTPIVKK